MGGGNEMGPVIHSTKIQKRYRYVTSNIHKISNGGLYFYVHYVFDYINQDEAMIMFTLKWNVYFGLKSCLHTHNMKNLISYIYI